MKFLSDSFEKINLYNGVLYKKENAEKSELSFVVEEIKKSGYEMAIQNSFGGAEFYTFTNGETTLNVTYKGKSQTLRIVIEGGINLPPTKCENIEKVDTLVTQMQTSFFSVDCGMSYIIRLSDGAFVVIDGGYAEYDEPEHFLELLNNQKIDSQPPVIKAWFITHPHADHYNMFLKIMNEYTDKVIVENVIYNWPPKELASNWSSNVEDFNECVKNLEETHVIIGRTGYRFELCGSVFEILYSPDDGANEVNNINSASIVIKQTTNERVILYLADIEKVAADIILKEYDEEYLKAEILQVAHHGFWGASNELYTIIDPETLIWPLPDFWYYKMSKIEQNEFLINSEKIKNVFFSNRQDTTINMSETVKYSDAYDKIKSLNVIYDSDFSKKSILALNWCCITGGNTGYSAAKAMFTGEGLRLKTQNDKMTVLEIVKPPMMESVNSYTVKINATIKNAEIFECICNYENPTEYSKDKTIDLHPVFETAEYTLTANLNEKRISVLRNDEIVCEKEYVPVKRHGIYIVIKNADITINKVTVNKI